MSAYLVGAIDIHDEEGYDTYRAEAARALQAYSDAEVLSADGHPEIFDGEQPGAHLLIVKFPSMDRLKAFFHSPEYQRAIPHRQRSSTTRFLMAMRGLDELK